MGLGPSWIWLTNKTKTIIQGHVRKICTMQHIYADSEWIKNFSESESIKLTLAAMLNLHMEKSNKMLRTTQIVLLLSLVSFCQRRLKCENLMDNRRWQMNSRWWKYQLTWTFGSGDQRSTWLPGPVIYFFEFCFF